MKSRAQKNRRQHRTGKRKTNKRNGGYGCGCGSQGCPMAPFPMKSGGTCDKHCDKCMRGCRYGRFKRRGTRRKGGSHFFQQGAPSLRLPPPFVGEPWTANPNTWPGYGASNNHGNHFAQNMYLQDPKMMMKLGGKTRKHKDKRRRKKTRKSPKRKRKRKRRGSKRNGGASFLQNAANSYRDLEYNFKSAYNAASGYEPPVNPLPYKDQLQPRQN